MNKKGALLFAPILVIMLIVGLLIAWSAIHGKYNAFDKKIGEKQFELIDAYSAGEKALLYIDISAKLATPISIQDLANNGGCYDGEEYSGYILWDIHKQDPDEIKCHPNEKSSKRAFKHFFSDNLNYYLSRYEPVTINLNNYNYRYSGNELIGIPRSSLNIPIGEDQGSSEPSGKYLLKPPFKTNLNYDFSDYDALRGMADNIIEECKYKNPKECITNNIHMFGDRNLVLLDCNDTYSEYFQLLEDIRIPRVGGGPKIYNVFGFCLKNEISNIIYKFALPFENRRCYWDDDESTVVLDYDLNTNCKEYDCDAFYACDDATTCYCIPPITPIAKNIFACEGDCIPYCGSIQAPSETKCMAEPCEGPDSPYNFCNTVGPETCYCPAPLGSDDNACEGRCCILVNGVWSGFSGCDAYCGTGREYRTCDRPAPFCGGDDCIGDNWQSCSHWDCEECSPTPECCDDPDCCGIRGNECGLCGFDPC